MAPPSPPLPLDALYEVLLRLPAKDLCRFRAVCRPWRALLSDPQFIAAHAACHPEPLIVAAHSTDDPADGQLLDVMDLSGRVIKRVVKPESFRAGRMEWVRMAQLDVVCVLMRRNTSSILLLNPVTGAVSSLAQELAEEHQSSAQGTSGYRHLYAVGKVASMGDYKVLRVLYRYQQQLCEVFTLDGSSHAQWRGKKTSPDCLHPHPWNRVSIKGIVYFLSSELVLDMDRGVVPLRIASFDLETEEWRAILRGPLNMLTTRILDLSVASLNGCLVVTHYIQQCSSMDLWFLMDFEKGLWAKQYSIPLKSRFLYVVPVRPLLVLNDGRILYYEEVESLRIYDPKTCTSTDVAEIGTYYEIGLYTVNLLSLPDGAGAQLMR